MKDKIFTAKQVAEMWGVEKRTILKLIKDNKLEAFKVGHRTIRISEEALNDFMKNTNKQQQFIHIKKNN